MQESINIDVNSHYIEEQSRPELNQFVFAYNITIENFGTGTVQLLNRYWYIKDSEERKQEVQGEGVIGEQPKISPGESYSYTSGVVIHTPPGTMQGHYEFVAADNSLFKVEIPLFALVLPHSLH